MKNYRLFNRTIFILLLLIVMVHGYGQTGLNFQGVARTNNNIILASQPISLRLSILQGSASGIAEYVETRRVATNAQGLFTAVIGDTGAISTLGNFTTINWRNTPKFLKIEMDPTAGTNFITMGTTQFQYVAYAQFASSVDAENITGVVPVARGGTGANSLSSFKTTLVLDKVNNTSDLSKPISTATQTALDLKLNAADTVKYVKQTYADSALITKLNLKDTVKFIKQTYADSALLTKLSITGNAATATSATTAASAGTASTATKLATARTINGVAFDGSADINITSTADAGTLTGTILKSTVTGSSLTSVGTLANLTVTNPIVGSITGNAATATKFATASTINGVAFDGSQDITIDTLKVGDLFGGGIVFFTWDNGKHGLIAAMRDSVIGSNKYLWKWSYTDLNTMAKSDGFGAGYKNMLLILARQGLESGTYAAQFCNEFKMVIGTDMNARELYTYREDFTISDWYLPSIHELNLLFEFYYRYVDYRVITGLDGFEIFWSSTEIDTSHAWAHTGPSGPLSYNKSTRMAVRPIRMF
jgi:hypothetical protein